MQQEEQITKTLLNLENKYWKAMEEHDLDTAISLTDFPCLVASPRGVMSVDKEQFKKMFNSHEADQIKKFKFDNTPEVRVLSADSAVLAYKIHSTFKSKGQQMSMDAVDTSTWIKRGNKWLCAMHTEAEVAKS